MFSAAILSLCLAYLMLRPVSNNEILLPVLAVMGIVAACVALSRGTGISGQLVPVAVPIFTVGALGSVVGAGNPGFFYGVLVWLAAPLLYWAWVAALGAEFMPIILRTCAWATILLSTAIVLYVASQLGMIPAVLPEALLVSSGAGFEGELGDTAIRLYGLSTLVAAAPMWVTALFVRSHPWLPAKWICALAAASATSASLIAGRRAVVLVLVVIPVVALIVKFLARDRSKVVKVSPVVVLTGLAGIVIVALNWVAITSNTALRDTFAGFADLLNGGTETASEGVRAEQISRLVEYGGRSPIWGHGFGSVINGYSRNELRPWTFEMQYHLLYMQVGLIGLALVAIALIAALMAFYRATQKRPDLLPVLTVTAAAALAILIANYTNPYLQAPGHMWAVYLVLAVINVALVESPPSTSMRKAARKGDLSLRAKRARA